MAKHDMLLNVSDVLLAYVAMTVVMYALCASSLQKFLCGSFYVPCIHFFFLTNLFNFHIIMGVGGGNWNYFSSFVFSVGNESLTCQDGGPSR